MDDRRPDPTMMIGLHKLASQCGDGLVPELYELLTRRAQTAPNVTEFPIAELRPPMHGLGGMDRPARDNILPFPCAANKGVLQKSKV